MLWRGEYSDISLLNLAESVKQERSDVDKDQGNHDKRQGRRLNDRLPDTGSRKNLVAGFFGI